MMKTSKLSFLAMLFAGILFNACNNEDNVTAPVVDNESGDQKMYSKIITISDLSGKKSGQLQISAQSAALLHDIENDFKFTLTTPRPLPAKQSELVSSGSDGEEIPLTTTKNKTFNNLENAVWVDILPSPSGEVLTLKIEKTSSASGRAQADYKTVVMGGKGWHYIRIDNKSKNKIDVSTLYKGCVIHDICIGYTHEGDFYDYFKQRKLGENKHTWITYCSAPVLAIITYDRSKAYEWEYTMSNVCKD
jgi:hypothetical protein